MLHPRTILSELAGLFYPRCCAGCTRPLLVHENTICLHCKDKLPFTGFEDDPENEVEKIFWGRVPAVSAASLIYFLKRGTIQNILHQLKYNGRKEVGVELGHMAGERLMRAERFSGIDAVIPIPLHKRKMRKRGYNQCTYIAKGISEKMFIPYLEDVLMKVSHNPSQTRKSKFQRWLNVKTIFTVENPEKIRNKHVLLIDDVVTTGATLEAAALKLLSIEGVRVSIFTVALTKKG